MTRLLQHSSAEPPVRTANTPSQCPTPRPLEPPTCTNVVALSFVTTSGTSAGRATQCSRSSRMCSMSLLPTSLKVAVPASAAAAFTCNSKGVAAGPHVSYRDGTAAAVSCQVADLQSSMHSPRIRNTAGHAAAGNYTTPMLLTTAAQLRASECSQQSQLLQQQHASSLKINSGGSSRALPAATGSAADPGI